MKKCQAPDRSEIKPIRDTSLLTKRSDFNKELLSLVPEFILTNIDEYLIFLSRFKDNSIDMIIEQHDDDTNHDLNSFMNLILLFMGNSDYLFNPHCRAMLAECLELLLPTKGTGKSMAASFLKQKREHLFTKHPCAIYLTEALLNVFVSIEMTGASVQFEQKFNYRRPMYEILEYVWTIDLHKNKIKVGYVEVFLTFSQSSNLI